MLFVILSQFLIADEQQVVVSQAVQVKPSYAVKLSQDKMRTDNTSCSFNENKTEFNQSHQADDDFGDEDQYTPYFSPKHDIIGILMALIIVLLNSWVFVLVAKKRSLRTPTNFFLVGLAASDFLTGLISLPLSITCNIFQEHGMCFTTIYIWMFTSFLAVSHISAVTADRFIAIMFSLRYPQIVTKHRSYIALGFVWVSSLLVSLMQLWWLRPANYDPHESVPEDQRQNEVAFSIACFVVYLGIPVAFMAFTYLMILREVRRQSRREFLNVPADVKEQRQWRKREGKAASIFLVMFLTHVMCWLPFFLLRYQQAYDAFFLPMWAEYMFGYLRFASSFLNPCFYVFGKHDFRKAWDYPCKEQGRNRAKSDLVMIMSSHV